MVKEKRYKCFYAGHALRLYLIVIHTNRRALLIQQRHTGPLTVFGKSCLLSELVIKLCWLRRMFKKGYTELL